MGIRQLSVLENDRVCSFTGHRIIKKEHTKRLTELLQKSIEYAYLDGYRTFCVGGAVGFDTLAAREVIRFSLSHTDVRLVLILPCINQDKKWNEAQRDAYEYVLKNASEIRYVSDEYTLDCMRRRNKELASVCELLIAYVGNEKSGSMQTVRMAKEQNKEIINLYETLEK